MTTPAVTLRPATYDDLKLLYHWRNLPEIIAKGSLQRAVTLEEHTNWFQMTLNSPETRRIFITERNGAGIGQVRFDREDPKDQSPVISTYILSDYRGQGFGVSAITLACRALRLAWPEVQKIIAHVRTDNPKGGRGFARAGFTLLQETATRGHKASLEDHWTYLWTPSSSMAIEGTE